jgi:hypothetical protein
VLTRGRGTSSDRSTTRGLQNDRSRPGLTRPAWVFEDDFSTRLSYRSARPRIAPNTAVATKNTKPTIASHNKALMVNPMMTNTSHNTSKPMIKPMTPPPSTVPPVVGGYWSMEFPALIDPKPDDSGACRRPDR